MRRAHPEFARLQREYFAEAEVERFRWTTAGAGFAETEDELLAPLLDVVEAPCLEIGCGEGNNLVRLAKAGRCVGVDLLLRKLHFAARELADVDFSVAEASALPFPDHCFRSVFVRDLLHHVSRPREVLSEAVRVLAPGGVLCLVEPNGRNPIMRLQTLLVPAEAGTRHSHPSHMASLLEGLPLEAVEIGTRQPLPLRRLLLHYRFGLPSLGRSAGPRRTLIAAETLLGRLVPRSRWGYVVATARRA